VTEEVVSVTGDYRDRIRRIARRYNRQCPQGLVGGCRVRAGRQYCQVLSKRIA